MKTVLSYVLAIAASAMIAMNSPVHAQRIEPRAYINAPVGINFLATGYLNSSGALLFDPAIPVTDADANVDMAMIGYVRTLDIAGKSAKAGVIVPYASLKADGYLEGNFVTREQTGFADPAFYLSVNLYGAPALSLKEFMDYQQDTIIGLTFRLTAPAGAYQREKLINIGTNRWSFEPELGISKAIGRWTIEGAAAVVFYTDNDEFDTDQSRQQEPIYSTQFNLSYTFENKMWASIGATYYTGGRTTIEGVDKDDLQRNWRTGLTLAIPVNRRNSIKLLAQSGVSTRTGTDYDTLGLFWQYRWGGGI
jgi:Putative MetA-pathway of phenol degradation